MLKTTHIQHLTFEMKWVCFHIDFYASRHYSNSGFYGKACCSGRTVILQSNKTQRHLLSDNRPLHLSFDVFHLAV